MAKDAKPENENEQTENKAVEDGEPVVVMRPKNGRKPQDGQTKWELTQFIINERELLAADLKTLYAPHKIFYDSQETAFEMYPSQDHLKKMNDIIDDISKIDKVKKSTEESDKTSQLKPAKKEKSFPLLASIPEEEQIKLQEIAENISKVNDPAHESRKGDKKIELGPKKEDKSFLFRRLYEKFKNNPQHSHQKVDLHSKKESQEKNTFLEKAGKMKEKIADKFKRNGTMVEKIKKLTQKKDNGPQL